jgi:hypothetical protein
MKIFNKITKNLIKNIQKSRAKFLAKKIKSYTHKDTFF